MTRLVVTQPVPGDSPCGACKDLYGATCCEVKSSQGPDLPMTYGEAMRFARHVGAPVGQVVNVRRPSRREIHHLARISKDEAQLIVNGQGLYLPIDGQDGRACRYLGPTGCTIPSIKPHNCALFPFAKVGGRWRLGVFVLSHGFCYGQDSAPNVQEGLSIFGVSEADLESIERRRQLDRKAHKRKFEEWQRKH